MEFPHWRSVFFTGIADTKDGYFFAGWGLTGVFIVCFHPLDQWVGLVGEISRWVKWRFVTRVGVALNIGQKSTLSLSSYKYKYTADVGY